MSDTSLTRRTGIALAITGLLAASPAMAGESEKPGLITMNGTGEARFAPDIATITIGTISQAKTAKEALAANNKAMNEAVNALKAAGIEARDLQTANFQIAPQYTNYSSGTTSRPPVITSYQVSNDLVVRVRDLSKTGEILDKAVSMGANAVSGPHFGLQDMEKAREAARKAAVENALAKARIYTQGLGIGLGRVIQVNEQGGYQPRPAPMARAMAADTMAAPTPAPIEAGESSLNIAVSVTWEIAR